MAADTKYTGMRLSPETLKKIEVYRDRTMWTPGQLFDQLLDAENRTQKAMSRFQPAVMNDGEECVLFDDPFDPGKQLMDGGDAEVALRWLVSELAKPLNHRFIEPFSIVGDPRK